MYTNIDKYGNIYVYESFRKGSKTSSRKVAKLGKVSEIMAEKNWSEDQVRSWAKEQASSMTADHKDSAGTVYVRFNKNEDIPYDEVPSVHVGYLFLQSIFYSLKLDKICDSIQESTKTEYSLKDILACLIYNRILEPGSKLKAYNHRKDYPEDWDFSEKDVYRSLDLIAANSDKIQSELYKNSNSILQRDTSILYYDCTNFHFEIEWADEDGIRQYGMSKNHMPNPIVQMGMFMDASGIPFSMNLNKGNQNEQLSVNKETFDKIKTEYKVDRFIYCADAGLGSSKIKQALNAFMVPNAYVVTQSIKKLPDDEKDWCLKKDDETWWYYQKTDPETGEIKTYKILYKNIDQDRKNDQVYYREKWIINSSGMEERIVVTYSPKYAHYLKKLRDEQLKRTLKKLLDKKNEEQEKKSGKGKKKRKRQTDPARLIKETHKTKEGEEATQVFYEIDEEKVAEEARYDGFYCVATDLEDDPAVILSINKGRQDIEAGFREMKTGLLDSRPVFVRTEEHIRAHFIICYISLMIFRILQRVILGNEFTVENISETLRKMKLFKLDDEGWTPDFIRTTLTDKLTESFKMTLQRQYISNKKLKTMITASKKRRRLSTFLTEIF